MKVSVITPTLPDRTELLAAARASVDAQARGIWYEHLILVDHKGEGPAVLRNRMARLARGGWLAFLDDDDMWLPGHLTAVVPHLTADHDVVFTLAQIEGRPGWDPQRPCWDPEHMRRANYIPLCGVVVRRSTFLAVGGFPERRRYEDHGLFLALMDAGARFHCVPEHTWVYRFGDWDSRSKQVWRGER